MTEQEFVDPGGAIAGSSRSGENPRRITAFLLPGVFGDEPQLVDFRRRLCDTIDLVVLDLPDLGSSGALLSSMEATSRVVTDVILSLGHAGPVALIGFSFGASLALAVAADLARAGRTVSFLGILDGPFRTDELSGSFAVIRRALTPKGAVKAAIQVAGRTDATRRLVLAVSPPARAGADRPDPIRRALLTHLRGKALNAWDPQGCHARGLLIVTGRLGAANRARWLALCPNLTCVEVEGEHDDLLKGPSLERVVGALVGAVAGRGSARAEADRGRRFPAGTAGRAESRTFGPREGIVPAG